MKTILTFLAWFTAAFIAVAMVTSVMAAESVKNPPTPPQDCSCGACE